MITLADIIMIDMDGQDIPVLALPEALTSHDALHLDLGPGSVMSLRSGDKVMMQISDVDETVLELLSDYANIPVLEVPSGTRALPEKLSLMADVMDNRAG
ncbi:MAG: hypothetical protein Alpg2KO_01430 [Alphaproteobacteria bacterium]